MKQASTRIYVIVAAAFCALFCTKPEVADDVAAVQECRLESAAMRSATFTVTASVPSGKTGTYVGVIVSKTNPKATSVNSLLSGSAKNGAYVKADPGIQNYELTLSALASDTEYILCPFVQCGGIGGTTSWGEQIEFRTMAIPSESDFNGHDHVDMGSGVFWATCNLGADAVSEPGELYSFMNAPGELVASWGGSWRLPKETEWDSLIRNCEWTWKESGGVLGYEVKAKNGNKIFLPAGGCLTELGPQDLDDAGYYWSSTVYDEYKEQSWFLHFDRMFGYSHVDYLKYGFSIRPVSD